MAKEAADFEALTLCAEAHLKTCSSVSDVPLKMVMFASAVEHLCRVARIIGQPASSALLVGVGGSGRRSLARLASFIEGVELHTLCRKIRILR